MPLYALFRLAFAPPPTVSVLSLPHALTRWLILLKARRQGIKTPPTGCKHTVSGSFHSPRRGSFHLSLTVLFRYRSSNVFSLRQWSAYLHTELACSVLLVNPLAHAYRTLTVFG